MNKMTETEARALAQRAHAGTEDQLGAPTIEHIARVAAAVPAFARVAAWLHDTVEDKLLTFEELIAAGISDIDLAAVRLLTRDRDAGPYIGFYIAGIADADGEAGRIARAVKWADLHDNSTRPAPEHMLDMRRPGGRYDRAKRRIGAAMDARGEAR